MTQQNSKVITMRFPQGKEMYNAIMSRIEPDLIDANIATLSKKYANETAKENAARLRRYRAAYKEYDRQFAAWVQEMNVLVKAYRRQALQLDEKDSHLQDSERVDAIEREFELGNSPLPA